MRALCAALGVAVVLAPASAQVTVADVTEFENWIQAYTQGEIPLTRQGRINRSADRGFRALFDRIASSRDMDAAKRLWQAAVIELSPELDKEARLQASAGRVRGYAKQLLAAIHDPAIDPWLIEIAMRRGGQAGNTRRMAAIEVLGLRESPDTGKLLVAQLPKLALPERIQAVLALERTGALESLPTLVKMLSSRDPNLRIALVQAISAILAPFSDETRALNIRGNPEGQKYLPIVHDAFRKLLMREKVWQVRVAVCDALVRLKAKASIPILIAGLERELRLGKWSNRMVAISFHEALEQMTGQDMSEDAPGLWKDFWKKEGAAFRFATREQRAKKRNPSDAKYAKYFNLDIKTKRLLFVIDFSGSMSEKVRLEAAQYARGSEHVKYQLVKRELEKVIRSLPRDTMCNVVFFSDQVDVWRTGKGGRPALVKMSDSNKSDLLQYVWETSPGGSTNLFGALETALAMGDRGVWDKYYRTAYDTIFVLSDGAPSSGEITDTAQIRAAVRRINKLRRVKIHTIVFGDARNNLRFMKALAEENGGNFLHVK